MFLEVYPDGSSKSVSGDIFFKDYEESVPLNFLIHLWLGHKKVLTFGPFKKWWYSDSLNEDFLLSISKHFSLKYRNSSYGVEYVFGPHAKLIIPALIEMGIFEKVVTQLLEQEKTSNFERRKEVAEMISKPEIKATVSGCESFMVVKGGVILLSPSEHFEKITKEFLESAS